MKSKRSRILMILMVLFIGATGWAYGVDQRVEDRVSLFGDIKIDRDTHVRSSAVAIFGDISVEGSVDGDVVAVFGNVTIHGQVSGNGVAILGQLKISSTGKIMGDAVQILGGDIKDEPGSHIGGQKVSVGRIPFFKGSGLSLIFTIILLFSLGKLIIGYMMSVIAVLVFPKTFDHIAHGVTIDWGRKMIIGILVVLGFYVISAMLVMIVIGIPAVLLLIPIMMVLGFTGNAGVKLALGKRIEEAFHGSWSQMGRLFVGTIAYGLVDLTLIGKPVTFLGKALGIGAVIDSRIGTKKNNGMGFIQNHKDDSI